MAEVFRLVLLDRPCCLADCFSWPQVALTHHVCQFRLYAAVKSAVKQHSGASHPHARDFLRHELTLRWELFGYSHRTKLVI